MTRVTDGIGGHGSGQAERPDDRAVADVAPAAPEAADDRARLPHEPALDGLRGLAVAAVVVFHLGRLDGGFLGVDLFFVLSGFLITSLLLTEHRGRQAIDLGRFWVRRARRLLPALFLVVVGIAVLLVWLTPEAERAGFRGDGLSTLLYVANWHAMVDSTSYWDMFGQPSPFDHMWSLAIEEQFYVLWPLVVLAVLRRGPRLRLGVLAVAGAAVSFVLLMATWSPTDSNRAYFATDTRLGPILLGAALAVVSVGRLRRSDRPAAALELLAALALGWMAVCTVAIDGTGPAYSRGGLASFAVAALVVIHVLTGGPPERPGLVGRAVAWPPLAWLGTVSYGVYLWHWPVIVYLTPERAHIRGLLLDVVRVAVTLAVATVSYRWVEQPIRRGDRRGRRGAPGGRRLRRGLVGAFAVSLVAVLVATAGTPRASSIARPRGTLLGADNDYLHVPASVPEGMPKLLLVGDSGPAHLGPELVEAGDDAGVAVAFSSEILCSVVYADVVWQGRDGKVEERQPCPADPKDLWADLVDELDPDVVVYYLANVGSFDHERVGGEWVWDCDPAYDRYLDGAIGEVVDVLGRSGARVVIATSPYVGIPEPTSGPRVDCRNATYRRVAAAHPGVGVVDLNRFVDDEIKATDIEMFADPVHLSDEGARVASVWLLDQLVTEPAASVTTGPTSTAAEVPGPATRGEHLSRPVTGR